MAHAAKIVDGIVTAVIVIPDGVGGDENDEAIEEFCHSIGLTGTWVRTSYNGNIRGKFAGVGDLFDPNTRNAEFISPVEVVE